jgi:hypothetical protein
VVWLTTDLTPAQLDALTLPAGWRRNELREDGGQTASRFLRSPGAAGDGEFTRQEMFGFT